VNRPDDLSYVSNHVMAGDFSLLEAFFREEGGPSVIQGWFEAGFFKDDPAVLLEVFTCGSFLGSERLVEALLASGLPPAGGSATGLSALHWAASRGQHRVLDLLLQQKPDLELLNQYGGTVLGQAVWSSIHEPRQGQDLCIEALVLAGADLRAVQYPTGHERTDAALTRAKRKHPEARDA
jgi:hypothetical protein